MPVLMPFRDQGSDFLIPQDNEMAHFGEMDGGFLTG
jgi:hypothetical protein